jgi:hypothetical protein
VEVRIRGSVSLDAFIFPLKILFFFSVRLSVTSRTAKFSSSKYGTHGYYLSGNKLSEKRRRRWRSKVIFCTICRKTSFIIGGLHFRSVESLVKLAMLVREHRAEISCYFMVVSGQRETGGKINSEKKRGTDHRCR